MKQNLIPPQLKSCRFIKVKNKKPFEKKWSTNKNYSIEEIESFGLKEYGVLCGESGLFVIDFDNKEVQDDILSKYEVFKTTFAVRTATKKLGHYYFIASDNEHPETKRFLDENENTLFDLQGVGACVVGPGSVLDNGNSYDIIQDSQIQRINYADLCSILEPYNKSSKNRKPKKWINKYLEKFDSDPNAIRIKEKLKISNILNEFKIDITHNPTKCPLGHNSIRNKSFSYDDEKGLWKCFHCEQSGDTITLYMLLHKLDFSQTVKILAKKLNIELTTKEKDETNIENEHDLVESKIAFNPDPICRHIVSTQHIPFGDEFNTAFQLKGDSYNVAKKGILYQIHSNSQTTQNVHINQNTVVDNRFHVLLIAPTSSGKTTIKNIEKALLKQGDQIEISGPIHSEQLIGKIKPPKKKNEAEKICLGYFRYHFIIHDEAQMTLNEEKPEHADTQRLKRKAMDTYGYNVVDKKLVDNDTPLSYFPKSRFLDLIHPVKLKPIFISSGSFRRYAIICSLKVSRDVDISKIIDFSLDTKMDDSSFKIGILKYYQDQEAKPKFTQDILDIIRWCHGSLLYYFIKSKNSDLVRYGLLVSYSLRDMITKNVFILAIAKKESVVSIETALLGCCDSILFILKSLESLVDYADLANDSTTWRGLDEVDAQAMTWLIRKGAVSPETSKVSVSDLWTVLANLSGTRTTQSRARYYKLVKSGHVQARKGKHSSLVWASFVPEEITSVKSEDFNPYKWPEIWLKSIGGKKVYSDSLKSFGIDEDGTVKGQSVETIGLWGFVVYFILNNKNYYLINNNIIDDNYNNYYNNYINNYSVFLDIPKAPIVSTLLKSNDFTFIFVFQNEKIPKTPTVSTVLNFSTNLSSEIGEIKSVGMGTNGSDSLESNMPFLVNTTDELAMLSNKYKDDNEIYLDIETYGEDPLNHTKSQVGRITLNSTKGGTSIINTVTLKNHIHTLKPLLESKLIIGQNLKFDAKFLKYHFGINLTNIFDTYVGSKILTNGTTDPNDLKSLIKRHCDIEIPKSECKTDWGADDLTKEQIQYCIDDIIYLSRIRKEIQYQLLRDDLDKVFQLECSLIPVIVQMELDGLKFDEKGLREFLQQSEEEKQRIAKIILTSLGPINLNSVKQLKDALNTKGINVQKTDEEELKKHDEPLIHDILTYRDLKKRCESAESLLRAMDNKGRVHAEFKSLGTETGRFSCTDPNLQNLSPYLKKFVIPEKDNLFIDVDYSQIELRLAGNIAPEPKFIEAFNKGLDLHKQTASLILKKPENEITDEDRRLAKAVNFGLLYGQNAKGFRSYAKTKYNLDLTYRQAEEYHKAFFDSYPGIKNWHNVNSASNKSEVRTLFGRRRLIPVESTNWKKFTDLVNTVVQGTGADGLKLAMLEVAKTLPQVKIVNSIHDELLLEVPKDQVENVKDTIQKLMVNAMEKFCPGIPIKISMGVGSSWLGAKK